MRNGLIAILVVAACIAVEAGPLVQRQLDLQCLTDDPVILALQSLSATPFCSSLLGISTTTITTTIASDALIITTVTATATDTTAAPVQVSTVTSTATLSVCSLSLLRKRGKGKCTKKKGYATTPTLYPGYGTKTENDGYQITKTPTYPESEYPQYGTQSSKDPSYPEDNYPHYDPQSSQEPYPENNYPHYGSESSKDPEYESQYHHYTEPYNTETQYASPTGVYPHPHPDPTFGFPTQHYSDTLPDTYTDPYVEPTYGVSSVDYSDTSIDTQTGPYTWPPLYESSSSEISDTFTISDTFIITSPTSTSTSSSTTSAPTGLEGFDPADLLFGCSCLSLPTPSAVVTATDAGAFTTTDVVTITVITASTQTVSVVTITTTATTNACPTTTTATPTATPTCDNLGVQWAEYRNFVTRANDDRTYSNFLPEVYKGQTPEIPGIYGNVGPISIVSTRSRLIQIYNNFQAFPSAFFALDHKAYFVAPTTGRYVFSVTNIDDAVFLWLGARAYSGWTRANADAAGFSNQGAGAVRASADITAGQYLPVRLMLAQSEGPVGFNFFVTGPDGTVLVSPDNVNSTYLVQFSCDGVTAPAFADWPLET
ncbi:hypothetical protein E8E14_007418 [Neopestalotiopsis sp. 37M]|nr:hypothetical protein E8E14_007418 [Neopestalotiopsis sp. 37M]